MKVKLVKESLTERFDDIRTERDKDLMMMKNLNGQQKTFGIYG